MFWKNAGGAHGKEEDELYMRTHIIKVLLTDTFGIDLTEEDKAEFKKMKDKIYSN
jgi:type I restriction enzyme R subunit